MPSQTSLRKLITQLIFGLFGAFCVFVAYTNDLTTPQQSATILQTDTSNQVSSNQFAQADNQTNNTKTATQEDSLDALTIEEVIDQNTEAAPADVEALANKNKQINSELSVQEKEQRTALMKQTQSFDVTDTKNEMEAVTLDSPDSVKFLQTAITDPKYGDKAKTLLDNINHSENANKAAQEIIISYAYDDALDPKTQARLENLVIGQGTANDVAVASALLMQDMIKNGDERQKAAIVEYMNTQGTNAGLMESILRNIGVDQNNAAYKSFNTTHKDLIARNKISIQSTARLFQDEGVQVMDDIVKASQQDSSLYSPELISSLKTLYANNNVQEQVFLWEHKTYRDDNRGAGMFTGDSTAAKLFLTEFAKTLPAEQAQSILNFLQQWNPNALNESVNSGKDYSGDLSDVKFKKYDYGESKNSSGELTADGLLKAENVKKIADARQAAALINTALLVMAVTQGDQQTQQAAMAPISRILLPDQADTYNKSMRNLIKQNLIDQGFLEPGNQFYETIYKNDPDTIKRAFPKSHDFRLASVDEVGYKAISANQEDVNFLLETAGFKNEQLAGQALNDQVVNYGKKIGLTEPQLQAVQQQLNEHSIDPMLLLASFKMANIATNGTAEQQEKLKAFMQAEPTSVGLYLKILDAQINDTNSKKDKVAKDYDFTQLVGFQQFYITNRALFEQTETRFANALEGREDGSYEMQAAIAQGDYLSPELKQEYEALQDSIAEDDGAVSNLNKYAQLLVKIKVSLGLLPEYNGSAVESQLKSIFGDATGRDATEKDSLGGTIMYTGRGQLEGKVKQSGLLSSAQGAMTALFTYSLLKDYMNTTDEDRKTALKQQIIMSLGSSQSGEARDKLANLFSNNSKLPDMETARKTLLDISPEISKLVQPNFKDFRTETDYHNITLTDADFDFIHVDGLLDSFASQTGIDANNLLSELQLDMDQENNVAIVQATVMKLAEALPAEDPEYKKQLLKVLESYHNDSKYNPKIELAALAMLYLAKINPEAVNQFYQRQPGSFAQYLLFLNEINDQAVAGIYNQVSGGNIKKKMARLKKAEAKSDTSMQALFADYGLDSDNSAANIKHFEQLRNARAALQNSGYQDLINHEIDKAQSPRLKSALLAYKKSYTNDSARQLIDILAESLNLSGAEKQRVLNAGKTEGSLVGKANALLLYKAVLAQDIPAMNMIYKAYGSYATDKEAIRKTKTWVLRVLMKAGLDVQGSKLQNFLSTSLARYYSQAKEAEHQEAQAKQQKNKVKQGLYVTGDVFKAIGQGIASAFKPVVMLVVGVVQTAVYAVAAGMVAMTGQTKFAKYINQQGMKTLINEGAKMAVAMQAFGKSLVSGDFDQLKYSIPLVGQGFLFAEGRWKEAITGITAFAVGIAIAVGTAGVGLLSTSLIGSAGFITQVSPLLASSLQTMGLMQLGLSLVQNPLAVAAGMVAFLAITAAATTVYQQFSKSAEVSFAKANTAESKSPSEVYDAPTFIGKEGTPPSNAPRSTSVNTPESLLETVDTRSLESMSVKQLKQVQSVAADNNNAAIYDAASQLLAQRSNANEVAVQANEVSEAPTSANATDDVIIPKPQQQAAEIANYDAETFAEQNPGKVKAFDSLMNRNDGQSGLTAGMKARSNPNKIVSNVSEMLVDKTVSQMLNGADDALSLLETQLERLGVSEDLIKQLGKEIELRVDIVKEPIITEPTASGRANLQQAKPMDEAASANNIAKPSAAEATAADADSATTAAPKKSVRFAKDEVLTQTEEFERYLEPRSKKLIDESVDKANELIKELDDNQMASQGEPGIAEQLKKLHSSLKEDVTTMREAGEAPIGNKFDSNRYSGEARYMEKTITRIENTLDELNNQAFFNSRLQLLEEQGKSAFAKRLLIRGESNLLQRVLFPKTSALIAELRTNIFADPYINPVALAVEDLSAASSSLSATSSANQNVGDNTGISVANQSSSVVADANVMSPKNTQLAIDLAKQPYVERLTELDNEIKSFETLSKANGKLTRGEARQLARLTKEQASVQASANKITSYDTAVQALADQRVRTSDIPLMSSQELSELVQFHDDTLGHMEIVNNSAEKPFLQLEDDGGLNLASETDINNQRRWYMTAVDAYQAGKDTLISLAKNMYTKGKYSMPSVKDGPAIPVEPNLPNIPATPAKLVIPSDPNNQVPVKNGYAPANPVVDKVSAEVKQYNTVTRQAVTLAKEPNVETLPLLTINLQYLQYMAENEMGQLQLQAEQQTQQLTLAVLDKLIDSQRITQSEIEQLLRNWRAAGLINQSEQAAYADKAQTQLKSIDGLRRLYQSNNCSALNLPSKLSIKQQQPSLDVDAKLQQQTAAIMKLIETVDHASNDKQWQVLICRMLPPMAYINEHSAKAKEEGTRADIKEVLDALESLRLHYPDHASKLTPFVSRLE